MPDVRPYLVPDAGDVVFRPWRLEDDDSPLPADLEGWDPETSLVLTRRVEIDIAEVRRRTRLPDDVPLMVVAGWRSSSSGMRGRAGVLHDVRDGEGTLTARLPGDRVGGTVTVRTTLVVGQSWVGPKGTPRHAGSVLAEDKVDVALEDRAGMFPIEVVDFATSRLHPKASWHLTLQPEMEKPFLGACWLSLNSRDSELIEAVSAKKPNARQDAVLAEMHHGVAQLMIEAAEMADDAFDLAHGEWPVDSVGDVLSRYIKGRSGERAGAVTLADVADRHADRAGRSRQMGFGRAFR